MTRHKAITAAFWATSLLVASLTPVYATEPLGTPNPATIEYPDGVKPDAKLIDLGRTLFFDKRLSGNQTQSCASCHSPAKGFGDGMALGHGASGDQLGRNTPALYNLAWNVVFFWDGRADSLEHQALGPIQAAKEMGMPSLTVLVQRLQAVAYYRDQFHQIFGTDTISADNLASAIAAFERTLISNHSAFDRYLAGDKSAMSAAAQRGRKIFEGQGQCTQCHDGPNFTDNSFHNIGIRTSDAGRAAIIKDTSLSGAFKTPGLRNVALTAPYMHDGSLANLEDVVRYYNKGGDVAGNRDKLMKPLHLSDGEEHDLVAFLESLTDPVAVAEPRTP
jgi:cytochrome c peroxidase